MADGEPPGNSERMRSGRPLCKFCVTSLYSRNDFIFSHPSNQNDNVMNQYNIEFDIATYF